MKIELLATTCQRPSRLTQTSVIAKSPLLGSPRTVAPSYEVGEHHCGVFVVVYDGV